MDMERVAGWSGGGMGGGGGRGGCRLNGCEWVLGEEPGVFADSIPAFSCLSPAEIRLLAFPRRPY